MITRKRKLGNTGEEIAVNYLQKQGYQILERNYQKKWGEIDIVAKIKETLVFVEVKSQRKGASINPEENLGFFKQKRLIRATETYLLEKKISADASWQIDLVAIELDFEKRKANLRHLKNVVWG